MSTTPVSSTATARPGVKKAFRVPNWVYGIGVGLLVAVFLFVMTLMFGRLSGEEFSPHGFKRRTFHYYELPLVRLQVWPVKRFDTTGDVENNLVTSNVLTFKKVDEPRWDLVRVYRGANQVADGDASILCNYLDLWDINNKHYTWLAWTTEHPKLAKIFWPSVAKLADEELYLFLPDLFELALGAEDPDEFDQALKSLLAKKYYEFGLVQLALAKKHEEGGYLEDAQDRYQATVELLTQAVALAPDHDTWKVQLESARKQLPPSEAAEKKSS